MESIERQAECTGRPGRDDGAAEAAETAETAEVAEAAEALEEAAASATADEQTSGLIRRVRRLAKLSQRELAHDLGVSQSAVAKWETGRTTPSARMLTRILDRAQLRFVAVRRDGEPVPAMRAVAARDAGGRRYPAHTFVWAEGWWAPAGSQTSAYLAQILCRSKDLGLPRVRYSPWWQAPRPLSMADVNEHPTWPELVAEAEQGWQPARRVRLSIPEWALSDSSKSRNRRPEEFRSPPRVSCAEMVEA